MAKHRVPVTAAIRALRKVDVPFVPHLYPYEARGGTRASSASLGVSEHLVIKTLIFEDADAKPLIVLMHGDLQASAKTLARHLGTRTVRPCEPQTAQKHSGYQVGGTSPFGTRKQMPVYAPPSLLDLEAFWINGGKRGFLIRITPEGLLRALEVTAVHGLGV